MSERSKKTSASRVKVSKVRSAAVKPGVKSTPVKRSGCFKERNTKSGRKSAKKVVRSKPGYSLYSSDSEEQISTLNCGIDRCSELLANLIQRKKGESQSRGGLQLVDDHHTPTQNRDAVFVPTAGTESPDTAVANMVDGRLARSRAPLVEVRTPFNQRLVSSTPDPEKNGDDDGFMQFLPEKDNSNRNAYPLVKNAIERLEIKKDDNQNYMKDSEQNSRRFRPVSFHEHDFVEGVKRFEDTFPACHNRKSSIGDFQYYLQRESSGFVPVLPSRLDGEVSDKNQRGDQTRTNSGYYSKDEVSPKTVPDPEEREPHNRDYLDPDINKASHDEDIEYSVPMFNSFQVKMFGPGYRRKASIEETKSGELESSQSCVARRADIIEVQMNKEHEKGETIRGSDETVASPIDQHQGSGQTSYEGQELQHATPMPSPLRSSANSVEPRAILGRHVARSNSDIATDPEKQQAVHKNEVEHFFLNYETEITERQARNDEDPLHVHFSEETADSRECYPSSLINPSTLNSNVCISKPVPAQLPMLETPANSPVSSKFKPRDLREVTLMKMASESSCSRSLQVQSDKEHNNPDEEDGLQGISPLMGNACPEELQKYEYEPDPSDHHWTVTPMNSPAAKNVQENRFINRAPATPAPTRILQDTNTSNSHPPPVHVNTQPPAQTQLGAPSRLEAVAGPRKLRYLVKELAEACKVSGDSDVQYVAEDILECMETIPQLKPTFNLQTEIDLLLQPLRSENSQLRRRLRVVNQQLKERERQEKENTSHGINFEMLHLQTDNASLHRQLKEEKEVSHRLSQEMERLKYERQKLIIVLSEKDNENSRLREENLKEGQQLQFELELAKKQNEGSHLRHSAAESENRILQVALTQRDSEISRLQDLVQTLKDGVGEVLRSLDNGHAGNGNVDDTFSLQKMLMLLNKQDLGSSPAKSVMSDPGQPSRQKDISSVKKGLKFENRTSPHSPHQVKASPLSRKAMQEHNMASPLSREAVQEHNKRLGKTDKKEESLAVLEKDFLNYMSPFNSSPKSDKGSVKELLLRNSYGKTSQDSVRPPSNRQVSKLPQPNFDMSDSGHETEGTPGAASRPTRPNLASSSRDSSSLQSDAFKGTELDLSLSTIEEDVRSVVSAVTSTTSLSTVDDRAFRDGIAALDANIAKVLNALEKTKQMFS